MAASSNSTPRNAAEDPLQPSPMSPAPQPDAPWLLSREWQRWVYLVILFLVTTSSYIDYYVLSVVLEPIKLEYHLSDTSLGLLSGFCFALSYAVAAVPIARWADRGNRITVISVSVTAWSAMTVVCGL